MAYTVKNGVIYGANMTLISQAEYDALSVAEKNNGTAYYIWDSDAVVDADDVKLGDGTVEDLAGSVATIETSPAMAAHSVGDHLLWNGQLYEVIAAIAASETLTPGTNITATTVGTELTALTNGLPQYTTQTGTTDATSGILDLSVSGHVIMGLKVISPPGYYTVIGYSGNATWIKVFDWQGNMMKNLACTLEYYYI